MKLSKKIIPLFIVFAILLSCVAVPAHAEDYVNTSVSWWDSRLHLAANGSFLGVPGNSIIGMFTGKVCQLSQDGFHHSDSLKGCSVGHDDHGDYAIATCKYCNKQFPVYGSDLSATYDSYVSELPANQIDSSGRMSLIIDGWHDYYDGGEYSQLSESSSSTTSCTYTVTQSIRYYNGNHAYYKRNHSVLSREFSVPVDGSYSLIVPRIDALESCDSGYLYVKYKSAGTWFEEKKERFGQYSGNINGIHTTYSPEKQISIELYANQTYRLEVDLPTDCWSDSSPGKQLWCKASDYYKLVLFQSYSPSTYPQMSLDYRPTSISAPVTYTDNSGHTQTTETNIVNETNKTVYNPVTGDTTTYDNWDYDYSTRTYTFSGGDKTTTTVTYGDEYMTVKEGDTTYIYNYYVAPSSDTPDNPETPSGSHTHNYTSAVTREATCTTAGIETFTCSECGNSYTKSIAALGHDWTIKEQIPTAYDDNGEIVTQGYTVYKCSRCGEEYKSTDGKPPESGGNSGSSLWDKIGQLLGTVGGGLLGLIGQFFAAIFDALISLAEMVNEKLSTILEMVLGWFEQFPALFSGFMAFLTAIFGFLPEEMLLLLEFGLAAVLFIGILKAIRRR